MTAKEHPDIQIGGKKLSAKKKCKKSTTKKQCGGAESYITVSTSISKKLVNDFKIPYKPAIMQKMLSIYRKKSSATEAVTQLKDADKYIREHKDEFIKKYEEAIKATEKSGGKKIVLKSKSTKKPAKKTVKKGKK